jgi:hypothetical protein
MGDLFQKFLNRVNRGYGQVDKNVFGGLLPGGSDSRLISAPQNPFRPAAVVRSGPFQAVRDVVLETSGLRKPEQFFIKAMTGGSKDITTMTPEELSLVKGAYTEKQNTTPLKDEQIYEMAKAQEGYHKQFIEQAKEQYASASPMVKNSPMGQMMLQTINTPFDINKALEAIKMGSEAQKKYAKNSGPVVSLYGQGRNMKMAYGSLSVFPQAKGGVEIYDRWKVDPADKVIPGSSKMGLADRADAVADLGEGGPIPALIYNAAKALGTYEPFDIRVNVPAQEWQNIAGKIYEATAPFKPADFKREEQGDALNRLNTLYFQMREKIAPKNLIPGSKITPFAPPLAP